MKNTTITIGTTDIGGSYVKPHSAIPALVWGEIVEMLSEYGEFEQGKRGTRFDTWLPKKGDTHGKG